MLIFILLLSACGLFAANLLHQPESVVRDDARDRWLVSCKQNGDIIAIDDNGKQSRFCTGLSSVRGLTIQGDLLYCACDLGVVGYRLDTAERVLVQEVPGSSFLNDIAVMNADTVFVSDSATMSIYLVSLTSKETKLFSAEIIGVNGLYYDIAEKKLLALHSANGGSVSVFNPRSAVCERTIPLGHGGLDGLARDDSGRWYFSSWKAGAVFRCAPDFSGTPEVVSSGLRGPADICIAGNRLAIPEFDANKVTTVTLTR